MGNQCCNNDQSPTKIYSTKALMNMSNFNGMDMYFSTENLSRLEGECIVVFSDKKLRIKRTNFAAIINKKQTNRVKEQIDAYIYQQRNRNPRTDSIIIDSSPPSTTEKRTTSKKELLQNDQERQSNMQSDISTKQQKLSGHFMIDIDLPTIKFTKILVILVEPWQGKASIKKMLENQIVTAMQSLLQKRVTEVAFVQFDDQLGIAGNIGAAILARSIHMMSHKLKIATICCKNIADQLTYFSFFESFKEQLTLTSYTKRSVERSNYY